MALSRTLSTSVHYFSTSDPTLLTFAHHSALCNGPFSPPPAIHLIAAFDRGHTDFNDFIKNDWPRQADQCLAYTKLALHQDNLVGYITMLSDSIILHESERKWFVEREFRVAHIGSQDRPTWDGQSLQGSRHWNDSDEVCGRSCFSDE